jgi:DNA polymerase-3 subunit alpha/error-prone DNA polymerase
LLEIFNRREFLEPDGLATIFILPEKLPVSEVELEEWVSFIRQIEERTPDDLYLGCGLNNLPGGEWLSAKTGLPLLWTEPLKFLTSAPRLVLLRAIEKKIPYPPELKRLSPVLRNFGPEQEKIALKKYVDRVKPIFRRHQ